MRHYFLIAIMYCVLFGKAQQDAQYNLYQFNPLIINPAFAGARDVLSVACSVRNQWSGFEGAPRTNVLSGHMPVLNKNLGLGLTIINDQLGPRNTLGTYANMAYILKFNRTTKLSFGLNVGYNRYQFNYSKLSFYTNENSVDLTQTQNHGALDINGGLYFKASSYFVGLSVSHLTKPTLFNLTDAAGANYNYQLRRHIFLTAGRSFVLNENLIFAPTVLIKNVLNKTLIDLNLNFFIKQKLWLGAFYRSGYGPGFLLQYYVSKQLKLGYSFDSGLKDARKLGATHEIMLSFDFLGTKSKTINPRFL